jgi:hypothetical protein
MTKDKALKLALKAFETMNYEDIGKAKMAVKIALTMPKIKERKIKLDSDLPPHQRHSDTSVAAATAIAPKFNAKTEGLLATMEKCGLGLTDEEGQDMLGIEGNSYRPCRVTLFDKGFVQDSGMRRKTKANKNAVVWMITTAGREHLHPQLWLQLA